MRALIDPDEATRRLGLIFPRGAFDTTLSGALAGWAVAGMIYTNAVASTDGDTVWIRPSGIIWQQADVLATRTSTEDRLQWYRAISKNHVAVQDLLKEWDLTSAPRFRENSRETPIRGAPQRCFWWPELRVSRCTPPRRYPGSKGELVTELVRGRCDDLGFAGEFSPAN